MITLDLASHRKARIWLGDLPHLPYNGVGVVERSLEAGPTPVTQIRRAAAELFIPAGARTLYGLLGGTFTPEPLGKLRVQAVVADSVGNIFDWSLATKVDEVYIGLPREYVESVLEGACMVEAIGALGAGVLRFDCAAHGRVGSSRAFFHRLGGLVVQLLSLSEEIISEEDLITLLQKT